MKDIEVKVTIMMPEAMDFDRAAAIVREQAETQIRAFFGQRHTDAERTAALEAEVARLAAKNAKLREIALAVAEGCHVALGHHPDWRKTAETLRAMAVTP